MRHAPLSGGLAALIHALGRRAGARPIVEDIESKPWASITFSGTRHRFSLRFDGNDAARHAQRLSKDLDYAEFDLGDHILVDIAVVDRSIDSEAHRLTVEALTIIND